jgi:hypothetical protein
MTAALGLVICDVPTANVGLARPMQRHFRPKPSLMISPCLSQASKVVPAAPGAAFLAANAKVNKSNAVRLRHGGAFGKLPGTV